MRIAIAAVINRSLLNPPAFRFCAAKQAAGLEKDFS